MMIIIKMLKLADGVGEAVQDDGDVIIIVVGFV